MTLALQTLSVFIYKKCSFSLFFSPFSFAPVDQSGLTAFVDPEQEKHECHISRGLRGKITTSDKEKKVNRQNEMCEAHSQ